MAEIDDGGPAFPAHSQEDVGDGFLAYTYPGMTLRDYFAAQALTGDWSSQSLETGLLSPDTDQETYDNLAGMYYRMADAMLRARKVPV